MGCGASSNDNPQIQPLNPSSAPAPKETQQLKSGQKLGKSPSQSSNVVNKNKDQINKLTTSTSSQVNKAKSPEKR